ncbi:sulfotransferase family protein [Lyngbya confervoides]|uniref:Sulfotransferase n=1 Tax=Lyngbya confervoides BDU141951 TaxID=1574623 RepID=A0ABD4T999_9CYAN|nr:sulfotransferase domain-containing protein [Lyngbya confervoides]MCM1984905.1 sulfotransferase [Lyngbya confervoides BDU141951]
MIAHDTQQKILPNFLIIGAAKAGTTSLYYYLKQHPDVYMSSLKEPHFFSFEGETLRFVRAGNCSDPINQTAITRFEDYCQLFQGVSSEKAIGEASPSYLHTPEAAQRIKSRLPDVKLIAILRHPVERAYSAFTGQYLNGIQQGIPHLTNFAEAIYSEEKFMRENWTPIFFYKKLGFYYEQLTHYYSLFSPKQIHVCLNEDLQRDATGTLQDIFRYLEIDDTFAPDTSVRAGVSGIPKNQFIYRMVKQKPLQSVLKPLLPRGIGQKLEKHMLNKPQLNPEIRQDLLAVYREDTLKLQNLLQRDLSAWLK